MDFWEILCEILNHYQREDCLLMHVHTNGIIYRDITAEDFGVQYELRSLMRFSSEMLRRSGQAKGKKWFGQLVSICEMYVIGIVGQYPSLLSFSQKSRCVLSLSLLWSYSALHIIQSINTFASLIICSPLVH